MFIDEGMRPPARIISQSNLNDIFDVDDPGNVCIDGFDADPFVNIFREQAKRAFPLSESLDGPSLYQRALINSLQRLYGGQFQQH